MLNQLKQDLKRFSCTKNVDALLKFYQTQKGGYGEGDQFLGVTVPHSRAIAKKYHDLGFNDLQKLISSPFHEERFVALIILLLKYKKTKSEEEHFKLYKFYYKNKKFVNNWDLVDSTAPYISGHFYYHYDDLELKKLLVSKKMWERRIAILSLFYFIRQGEYHKSLKMIEIRLIDSEDLMQKACGWMLREIGNRNPKALEDFLAKYAKNMPRTALRYSIEKLSESKRKYYLNLKNTI